MNPSRGKLVALLRKYFRSNRPSRIVPITKHPKRPCHLSPKLTRVYDITTIPPETYKKYIQDYRRENSQ
ncbi:uncharacterized protein BBOV_IV005165 [Babesia bovis T2Bo]|uniref:uncharacterized protein n=1 Tax=Babesia bovis T2Bo TaxID=484906 RepID=UPI001DBC0282|nr:uncharacterized protein BBOV_IV005165 [Babesia bovis T2Bo]KAG6439941.1 hypothetical protein BBOV_IV005165 [Babesia bovis T2Bo]